MKILYIYPYPGELGWIAFNAAPHAMFTMEEQGRFDYIVAHVRQGYDALYRFADRIENFGYFGDATEGNAFVLSKPEAYDKYKKHCVRCDKEVEKLRAAGNEVVSIRLPKSKYRYHRYKMRHRKFVQLLPDPNNLVGWEHEIDPGAVVFHLRHITRSQKKNTSPRLYKAAAKWARNKNRQFVTIGATGGFDPKFDIQGLNLLNKTTIEDVVSIYSLGGMVVGSSSGPMHLASLTRTPHIVWGGGRNDVTSSFQHLHLGTHTSPAKRYTRQI